MGKHKYAILILAAGSSERLGRPKQLVKWNKTTLLNHTIDQASNVEHTDVFVALGGNQNEIRRSISERAVLLDVSNWREGIGSSIASSLMQIQISDYVATILSVCDQPYISTDVFKDLIIEFEKENSTIVSSNYKIDSGPPTLFDSKHYEALLKLHGDQGAKKIVLNNMEQVRFIQFQNGYIDIDTPHDLNELSSMGKKN